MRPHVLWFETAGSRQPETDNVNRDGGAAQAYSQDRPMSSTAKAGPTASRSARCGAVISTFGQAMATPMQSSVFAGGCCKLLSHGAIATGIAATMPAAAVRTTLRILFLI